MAAPKKQINIPAQDKNAAKELVNDRIACDPALDRRAGDGRQETLTLAQAASPLRDVRGLARRRRPALPVCALCQRTTCGSNLERHNRC